jgi:hypothetical protein
MTTDFPFFKGDAIPAEKLERQAHRKFDWQKILGAVKVGTAQAVDIKFDVVRNAILKLESEGKIPVGEYYARTRGSAGKKRVTYIVRKPHQ